MTLTVLIFILAIFLYDVLGIWGMIWAQGPHTVLEPVLVVEEGFFAVGDGGLIPLGSGLAQALI